MLLIAQTIMTAVMLRCKKVKPDCKNAH